MPASIPIATWSWHDLLFARFMFPLYHGHRTPMRDYNRDAPRAHCCAV